MSSADLTQNPIWVKRFSSWFDSMNLNHDKYLTIDELLLWAKNIEKACKATPEEIKAVEKGIQDFWGGAGLKPGAQLTKDQFLQGMNQMAQCELKRKAEGKETLYEKMMDAFFDVTDINNDGTVTLEELETLLKACKSDPNGAKAWLQAADTNKNGKVERNELKKCEFDFWFRPENPDTKGMFGGFYE